jgi:hypothetical protein
VNHTSYIGKHKVDSFHADAIKMLTDMGFTMIDFSKVGGGVADALAGAHGEDDFLEFKTGDAPYTEAQKKLRARWRGRKSTTLRSLDAVREWGLRTLHERCRRNAQKQLAPCAHREATP